MDVALEAAAPKAARPRLGALLDLVIWSAFLWLPSLALKWLGIRPSASLLFTPLFTLGWMTLLVLVTTWLLTRRGESWRSVGFTGRLTIGRTAALVFGGYVAVIVLNLILVLLVLPALHVHRPSLAMLAPMSHQPAIFAVWLVVGWVSAAFGEELQFRGFLLSRLERLIGRGGPATALAVLLQAVVFGVGHGYQGLGGMLQTGALGLLFGGIFLLARRNLVPGMLLHALVDSVALTLLFLGFAPKAA